MTRSTALAAVTWAFLFLPAVVHGADEPAPLPEPAPSPSPEVTPLPEAPAWRVPPRNRIVFSNLSVTRYNPIGLENQLRAGFQRRLFDSDSPVARDNFVFLGTTPKLNPAYSRVGPTVEIQPLSIFNVRAGVEHVRFFSTFGFLQSFPSPRVDYSDSALEEYETDFENDYATSGVHTFVEPTIQLKVGSIVVRNKLAFDHWDMDLRDGDRVFYEATQDTLLPGTGWSMANDADLLYATETGLVAGLRHTFVRPVYEDEHFADGEERGYIRNRHQRLGLLAAYTFHDRGFQTFSRPTVLVITSWYLSHRWRTGEDVSQGVPYVIVGFAFHSDMLSGR